jgi:hypothetical protein
MNIGEYIPDNLIIVPGITRWLTIASGTFKRGTVVTFAASTSDRPARYAVLMEDVDATGGSKNAVVMITGRFARTSMLTSSGGALTDSDVIDLSFQEIHVENTIPAA